MTTAIANRTAAEVTAEAIEAAANQAIPFGYNHVLQVAVNPDKTFSVQFSGGFDVIADDPHRLIADSLRRLAEILDDAAFQVDVQVDLA